MKKFFIYMASAAFMFAACNQAEIEAPVEDNNTNIEDVMPVETETITVDLNPMTKTSLDGMNTVWSAGDEVSVTVAGKNIGNLKLVGGSTFSGEVEAGHNGDAILNYPAGVTAVPTEQKAVENSFANGAALLEGTTTMDALRNGKGASLQNKTALLKFKSARSGNVAFTVGTETYTVTECEANKEYYASIAPAAEALLSYTLSGNAGTKSVTTSFEAGKIYSLGTLTEEFVPQEGYVYLIPNDNWKSDNARFAAYFFSQTWVSMTLVEGQVNVYQSAIPEGEKGGMLFCRMNPNNEENRWNGDNEENAPVWNQTIDLSLTDGCIYTMNEGSWDTGTWSGNPAVEKPVLPEVDATRYGLVGTFQGWEPSNPLTMTNASGNWLISETIEMYKDDAFKFVLDKSWDVNYGTSSATTLEDDKETSVVENGQNMAVSKNGKYNLYFDPNAMLVKAVCIEEFTDLTVTITIDNEANWSPLTITLKEGGNVIVDKATVTDGQYVIDANYIGSTLVCQFHSGNKASKEEELTITKNGAKATVESAEEEKPKLYLTPNTNWENDNARFAAYFFGNGEKWVSMTDPDKDGVYEVEIPTGYPNVIFCRMNPNASANNWNNKWNQTADLVIPTNGNNHYTVKAGTWDKGGGTWSTK